MDEIDYGPPTGQWRTCELPGCGREFELRQYARYHRFCSVECWRTAEDDRDEEMRLEGEARQRRRNDVSSQADVEAREARAYQHGREVERAAWQTLRADEDRKGYRRALVEMRDELVRNLAKHDEGL